MAVWGETLSQGVWHTPDVSHMCVKDACLWIAGSYSMTARHTPEVMNRHLPHGRGGRASAASRYANASSSAFASCRSVVSKPSVNQL
jgi:hypothetical protein